MSCFKTLTILLIEILFFAKDGIYTQSTYINCYECTLCTGTLLAVQNSNSMTNEFCISECSSRSKSYAGTRNGVDCFCFDSYSTGILQSGSCTAKCQGNQSQYCGSTLLTKIVLGFPVTYYLNSIYYIPPIASTANQLTSQSKTSVTIMNLTTTTPATSSSNSSISSNFITNANTESDTVSSSFKDSYSTSLLDQNTLNSSYYLISTNQNGLITPKYMNYSKTFILSDLLKSFFQTNTNISQLLDLLTNKTFLFDLDSDISYMTNLLKSNLDINNCVSNCSNYGVCKLLDDRNSLGCICDPDHTGSKCEIDQRPCSTYPCLNYEKCENVFDSVYFDPNKQTLKNIYSDFKCYCKQYFYGKRCELEINLCQNETCSGNGICREIRDIRSNNKSIKCNCFGIDSFEGDKCELKTSKRKIVETAVKTSTIIAICVLVLFFCLFIFMDIHKYVIMKKRKKLIKSKK